MSFRITSDQCGCRISKYSPGNLNNVNPNFRGIVAGQDGGDLPSSSRLMRQRPNRDAKTERIAPKKVEICNYLYHVETRDEKALRKENGPSIR